MDIPTNVAYLAGLSAAAERLVEILRGLTFLTFPKSVPPTGRQKTTEDIIKESKRVTKVNLLAVGTGVVTALLAYLIGVLPVADGWLEAIVFGVLAGAGSGFWNGVLSYMIQVKDLTKEKALATSATRQEMGPEVSQGITA